MRHIPYGIIAVVLATVLHPHIARSMPDESTGTSPAAFLEIPVGASGSVVPEIVAGMRPDGALLFSNPSALGDLRQPELFFTTSNWLGEFNLSAATAAVPIRGLGLTWSAGARLLYSGDLSGYDATGSIVAEERYYDMAFTSGFGKRFDSIGLSLGGGVTYLREHLAVEDGNGVTFTLGAAYTYRGHRLSAAVQDLGGRLRFQDRSYDIDARTIVGYGYRIRQHWGILGLGSQATFARDRIQRVDFGLSYDPNRYLTLRSGFGHSSETTAAAEVPLTAGMSIHLGDVSLDYAFTPRQYFSDTHTISVRFAFGSYRASSAPSAVPATAPVFASSPAARPGGSVDSGADGPESGYLIIAGTHRRHDSAEAEARSLQLLKIPARVESIGDQYWVVVERHDTRDKAVAALRTLRQRGHRFSIVVHDR